MKPGFFFQGFVKWYLIHLCMNETSICINRVYVLTFSPECAVWVISKFSSQYCVLYTSRLLGIHKISFYINLREVERTCPIYHRKNALVLMGLSHYFYATTGPDIDMNDSNILRSPSFLFVFTYSFQREGFPWLGRTGPNIA